MLLILSVASLSLFLVYRREYNRLHYVLEVFNFFGQPCNISSLQQSENILNQHDWGATPLWQENEKIYFYSGFWMDREAKVLALLVNNGTLAKNCYLWFDDKRKPFLGKLRFLKISETNVLNQKIYWFICSLKSLNTAPYAVSFSIKNKKLSQSKKILLTNSEEFKPKFNITLCVSPTAFNKTKVVEFLSFHKLIGIDSFIFYGGGIPHRLSKLLINFSDRLGIHLTFLPWNYPSIETSLTRDVIAKDCLERNRNQSMYVAILETDEYIVPSDSYNLHSIINSPHAESQQFALPVQNFCLDSTDSQKPLALQNAKVYYDDSNQVNYIYNTNTSSSVISVHKYDKSYASIHKYVKCVKPPQRSYVDDTILKFSTDFIRSTLVQLLKHDQL